MSACYCDYDPAVFYSASIRRARKRYQCAECSGFIEIGEPYEYVSAKWDDWDGVHQIRTCERCYDIRKWVGNNVPCFCFMHGDLCGTAFEAVEEARQRAPAETVGLLFGLHRRFIQRDRLNRERAPAMTPSALSDALAVKP